MHFSEFFEAKYIQIRCVTQEENLYNYRKCILGGIPFSIHFFPLMVSMWKCYWSRSHHGGLWDKFKNVNHPYFSVKKKRGIERERAW